MATSGARLQLAIARAGAGKTTAKRIGRVKNSEPLEVSVVAEAGEHAQVAGAAHGLVAT